MHIEAFKLNVVIVQLKAIESTQDQTLFDSEMIHNIQL